MSKLECYTNRELSWLQFNERVLEEAGNPRVPLAERLSFVSIYQSNLDEFFMVRMGELMAQRNEGEKNRENKTLMTGKQQIKAILKRTAQLDAQRTRTYEHLMGELEPYGVRIINFNRLTLAEGLELEAYFDLHIAPYLTPTIISKREPLPFLQNKQLYAVGNLTNHNGKSRIGIVSCENKVFRRLIEIPSRPGTFMLSEELILHFLSKVFSRHELGEKSVVRVTRNADLNLDTAYANAFDCRDTMTLLLHQRARLSPVRLELTRSLGNKTEKYLTEAFGLSDRHVFHTATPLDLSFMFQLQDVLHDRRELFYANRSPRLTTALDMKAGVLEQVARRDVLLHYPYESMRPFLELLHEAAEDASVQSIKITLYRVAARSKVVETLIEAAENGKEVLVLMELRARFDEENNINVSHQLEDAGCRVIYGPEGYKVHSKLCLITRTVDDQTQYITQIGTGNYNEKTARLYTDLCLMTGDRAIGAEAERLFDALRNAQLADGFEALMVAPHCLQNRILAHMDEQIARAKAGERAYIGIKTNALTDKIVIVKLIEASCAGVKIELIVRGICCLKPEIEGATENITIISVVGRYLEHSRIYRFGIGEQAQLYISSADLMTRNTLQRVEVAAPVRDAALRERVEDIFDTLMADDEKGRQQHADGLYTARKLHEQPLCAQELFFQQAYDALTTKEDAT